MSSIYAYAKYTSSLVEYETLNEDITIYPNFTDPTEMMFIEATRQPFRAGVSARVPLWQALHLLEKNKCRIARPTWMDPVNLRSVIDKESPKRDGGGEVQQDPPMTHLPFYYAETATLLFRWARDDLGKEADEIMEHISAIEEIRSQKVKKGIKTVLDKSKSERDFIVNVTNIAEAEYSSLRVGFTKALDMIYALAQAQTAMDSRMEEEEGGVRGERGGAGVSRRSGDSSMQGTDSFGEEGEGSRAEMGAALRRHLRVKVLKRKAAAGPSAEETETGTEDGGTGGDTSAGTG